MKDSESTPAKFGADAYTLEQRKTWYSDVADAYNRTRPRYPKELINRAINIANLSADNTILEIGCGPGIATVEFANLGFSLVCLEPSQDASNFARLNCANYPNVEIKTITFEEWELEPKRFNAVLAATSIHWVSPDIAYAKAAASLQDRGSLILLWNMTPQPDYEVYQLLQEVYQIHAPSLGKHETQDIQLEQVEKFGQSVINSGYFKNLVSEQIACEASYSIDDYLSLLSTLSPYIALSVEKRTSLFDGLREVLENNGFSNIQVSYLSAFHIAEKI